MESHSVAIIMGIIFYLCVHTIFFQNFPRGMNCALEYGNFSEGKLIMLYFGFFPSINIDYV